MPDESSGKTPLAPGLYVVSTPIGNLGDITLRALEVLRGVDRIACEDTRQTQKLLNHFQIATPTVSCHEHNEHERARELVKSLTAGARIALVSDAGTPAVSDPGSWLVHAAIAAGITVIPIPGANAALAALAASGLPSTDFRFLGFLPEKAGARRTFLESLTQELTQEFRGSFRDDRNETRRTLVFYEAPHRILETLADLEAIFGAGLRISLARELTKLHEEFLRGTVAEVRSALTGRERVRGEMTLVVEVPPRGAEKESRPVESLAEQIARMQSEDGIDEKEALKRVARERGQSKSEVYRELQRSRQRRG